MTKTRLRRLGAALALACVPEAAYFLGYFFSDQPDFKGDCGVLVLGFPTRKDGTPHPLQRQRVAAGVEAFQRCACERMVMAGGSPHSPHVEAETMARLAVESGVPAAAVLQERKSKDTLENIALSLPLLQGARRVIVVSDPLHVHRAKRLFRRADPTRSFEVFTYTRYRPLERYGMKWLGSLNEFIRAIEITFQ